MDIVYKTWLCSASVSVLWKQPSKSKCIYKPGGVFHSGMLLLVSVNMAPCLGLV